MDSDKVADFTGEQDYDNKRISGYITGDEIEGVSDRSEKRYEGIALKEARRRLEMDLVEVPERRNLDALAVDQLDLPGALEGR